MTGGSESGLGILDGTVGGTDMALADNETAGLNVAGAFVGELNALLEAADSEETETALADARSTLEAADGSSVVEAFEAAEDRLATATETATSEDVEFDLRQIRQAMKGLTGDGADERGDSGGEA